MKKIILTLSFTAALTLSANLSYAFDCLKEESSIVEVPVSDSEPPMLCERIFEKCFHDGGMLTTANMVYNCYINQSKAKMGIISRL